MAGANWLRQTIALFAFNPPIRMVGLCANIRLVLSYLLRTIYPRSHLLRSRNNSNQSQVNPFIYSVFISSETTFNRLDGLNGSSNLTPSRMIWILIDNNIG